MDDTTASEDTITDRGFRHTKAVDGTYADTRVKVYESSAASEPCVWVSASDSGEDVAVHLTVESARTFAANIIRVCDLHYQVQGDDGDA